METAKHLGISERTDHLEDLGAEDREQQESDEDEEAEQQLMQIN